MCLGFNNLDKLRKKTKPQMEYTSMKGRTFCEKDESIQHGFPDSQLSVFFSWLTEEV